MTKYLLVKTIMRDIQVDMEIIGSSYDKSNLVEEMHKLIYAFMQTALFDQIKINKDDAYATIGAEDYENDYDSVSWNVIGVCTDFNAVGIMLDFCYTDGMPFVYGEYDSINNGIEHLKKDKELFIISEEKDSVFFVKDYGKKFLKFFEI